MDVVTHQGHETKAAALGGEVKIGPFFSALPNMAQRLVQAGANGLVLFSRLFQPDLDLESRRSIMCPVLSSSDDLRLPLRWIAL